MKHDIDKAVINGNMTPNREAIEKGLRQDLNMCFSLIHNILTEKKVFDTLVDTFYDKWKEDFEKANLELTEEQNVKP